MNIDLPPIQEPASIMKSRWLVPVLLICALTVGLPLAATPSGVLIIPAPFEVQGAYDRVYKALEAEKFWVVFEADMGARMARFAERWGADYNRNHLGGIKAMVFCNVEWTNNIANADPDLVALCPLHLTVFEHDGQTFVAMPRLSVLAQGSPGEFRVRELEAIIRGIVENALTDG